MPAFHIFDQEQKVGPFEVRQIAEMWKQGQLTANAQYWDVKTQEWRSASELMSPIATALKRALEEAKRPRTPEELRAQKCLGKKAWWIPGVVLLMAFAVIIVNLTSHHPYGRPETEAYLSIQRAINAHEVKVGMTAVQCELAWGRPKKINPTVMASGQSEQWVYGSKYLYLQDGVLTTIQGDPRALEERY